MKVLAIDGNSILNRAFYGIKLLTTKDGRFTNGIYGFLSILHKLLEDVEPDAVAVAFDLKAPTFRHKLYDGYKAQRKGMPDELAQQLQPLKELLGYLGYSVLEVEGYEADDILGTLARISDESGSKCYIATGDRDSLQLVSENVNVLLATTKLGRPQTELYNIERIADEYKTVPSGMIEIKALMGDSSDNIPGVAGIGMKTASTLIEKYNDIDTIYGDIEALDVTPGVRKKLIDGRDMAYLSRELGTIFCDVPIDNDINAYRRKAPDDFRAVKSLTGLEMYSMIERLGLDSTKLPEESAAPTGEDGARETLEYVSELSELIEGGEGELCIMMVGDGRCAVRYGGRVSVTGGAWIESLGDLLADDSVGKLMYDSKSAYVECFGSGTELRGVTFDVLLAAYVLNPSASKYDVSNLILEYGADMPEITGSVPEDAAEAVRDVSALMSLKARMTDRIAANDQEHLLYDIELPLAKVLAEMEREGMQVDPDGIREYGVSLEGRIGDITADIYGCAGQEFNINSPKQLGVILFEELKLPCRKKTKTGYSTNAEVLEGLIEDHPIIERILEYRQLSKLKSTYCDGLLKVIQPDGRIHSTFNQTETRTGRLSSLEPNLQNIPIRQEVGRELRRFFTARKGYVLVDADYSQVELRVLAHMANDDTMIEAFNSGQDIHTITASQVFNVKPEEVTGHMRSSAKAVNFGIIYGIGAFSLAKDIGVTRAQADQYIKSYLAKYSGVAEYMDRVVEQAKADGYVTTLFKRRRYLPELSAANRNLRAFGERVARNMPIQGTAADIIKIAMIRVDERLKKEKMKSKLIMQVHDELIVEAPEDEADTAAAILRDEMENACEMKVKLLADVHTGKTWYEAKE